jgi:signal transduction histidine kinase
MNRLICKYFAFQILILLFIFLAFSGAGYLWFTGLLTDRYRAISRPAVNTLSPMVSGRVNRAQVRNILDVLENHPDIVMTAAAHSHAKFIFARGQQKRSEMIWPLSVTYPLVTAGRVVGGLRVWPAPESVFRLMTDGKNPYIILSLFLGWFGLSLLSVFLYARRHIFLPAAQFNRYIDCLEQDGCPELQIKSGYREWQQAAVKLTRVSEKISDTNATLQMLFSVSQTLTTHLEINDIFTIVIEIVQKKFGDVPCAVFLLDDDQYLKIRTQRGFSPEFVHRLHVKPGEGSAGQAFQKCQTVVQNNALAESAAFDRSEIEGEGIESFIFIPLLTEMKCVGLLHVGAREQGYFTADRMKTLSTLAKYLSIALRNAQLYERVQELNRRLETEVSITTHELIQTNSRLIQKVREMKALSDISAFAAARASLPEILDMAVERIKELLSAQAAGIFLYAEESGEMIPCSPFFGIKDRDFSGLHFKLEESPTLQSVVAGTKSFTANDAVQAAGALPMLSSLLTLHSLVLVPLRSGKKNTGVLGVANKFSTPFNQDDLRILELIADRVAAVIENVRLYQELERRLHDLTALQEISSAISGEPVWEATLKKIVATTTQAFSADLCHLLLYDEKTKELVSQPGALYTGGESDSVRIPVDDPHSTAAETFRRGEPFHTPDATLDPRVKSKLLRQWSIRSYVAVPLRAENRGIGVLGIGRKEPNSLTKDHLRLALLVAHQSATIIENARLYASLKEAKVELEQLNQIKNEFISMVSHELRTPITAIKGFVKVVLAGETGELNPQQEKFLQIADQSIDRLTILISDLLDISRIESGQLRLHLTELSSRELLETVSRNIAGEIGKKNLLLQLHLPEKLPQVMADRERLTQVFDNLITNSIKFTPDGGTITIAAQDKGDFVLFSVTDTGIGISKDQHQRIFDKFYQVETGSTRNIHGTGLGLAIVKSIVEIHGGQIWVESELGKGSSFQFLIPRVKSEIKNYHPELTGQQGTPEGRSQGKENGMV